MPSYYSVVRFVPSALAEEFVNVGVIAFGEGKVLGKFLDDWRRVQHFAGSGTAIQHARAFENWIIEAMTSSAPLPYAGSAKLDEATVRRFAADWSGSVQLSAPRGSVLDAEALLEDVAALFLVEPPPVEHAHDRRTIIARVTKSIRQSIAARASAEHMVAKTRFPLSAKVRPRVFDIVLANGVPRHAVQCFDFDVLDPKRLLERIDAFAYAVEDVRRAHVGFPVSVVASSSKADAADALSKARATFEQVGAEFVQEPANIDDWTAHLVTRATAAE